MSRISKINMSNYRTFFNEPGNPDKYTISLCKGENLLVYGENGSGKSSLFSAIEDLHRSIENEFQIEGNIFAENSLDLPETLVKVEFGAEKSFVINQYNSTAYQSEFFNYSSVFFLSYKDILSTYFSDFKNEKQNPNLFDLFFNVILKHVTDTTGLVEIQDKLNHIEQQAKTFYDAYKVSIRREKDLDAKNELMENLKELLQRKIDEFNQTVHVLIKPILNLANQYLDNYFNFRVKISIRKNFKFIKAKFNRNNVILEKRLFLGIKLHNKSINSKVYQSFLNEARLSALAMTVYLAALKLEDDRIPSQNIKFLFLDDIFIGLDTSNRIPLLEILNKDFGGFQIFITTYDRHWFEIAKQWFASSQLLFKNIELYITDCEFNNHIFETPLIIDPSLPYLEKAKLHFLKKDYPASANYLRKACEVEIKRILPRNMKLKENSDTGELKPLMMLGELFDNFKVYIDKNGLDIKPFEQFGTRKKVLLNALSHDDLSSPIYRKEIEDGIKIAEKFQGIITKVIMNDNQRVLKVALRRNGEPAGNLIHYVIELLEALHYIKQDESVPVFSNCKCILKRCESGQTDELIFNNALETILVEQEYDYPSDVIQLCKYININSRKKLFSEMNFL